MFLDHILVKFFERSFRQFRSDLHILQAVLLKGIVWRFSVFLGQVSHKKLTIDPLKLTVEKWTKIRIVTFLGFLDAIFVFLGLLWCFYQAERR